MQKTFFAVLVSSFLSFSLTAMAQDTPADGSASVTSDRLSLEKTDADSGKASKDLKVEETKPRVPRGYGKIANDDQKKQIREVMKEYGNVIAALKERIRLLEQERNSKVESLLTDEQRSRVKAARR
jgi:TolA-binding protein